MRVHHLGLCYKVIYVWKMELFSLQVHTRYLDCFLQYKFTNDVHRSWIYVSIIMLGSYGFCSPYDSWGKSTSTNVYQLLTTVHLWPEFSNFCWLVLPSPSSWILWGAWSAYETYYENRAKRGWKVKEHSWDGIKYLPDLTCHLKGRRVMLDSPQPANTSECLNWPFKRAYCAMCEYVCVVYLSNELFLHIFANNNTKF